MTTDKVLEDLKGTGGTVKSGPRLITPRRTRSGRALAAHVPVPSPATPEVPAPPVPPGGRQLTWKHASSWRTGEWQSLRSSLADADLAVKPAGPAKASRERPRNSTLQWRNEALRIINEVGDRNSTRFLRIFDKLPLASGVGSGLKGLGVERMPSNFVG